MVDDHGIGGRLCTGLRPARQQLQRAQDVAPGWLLARLLGRGSEQLHPAFRIGAPLRVYEHIVDPLRILLRVPQRREPSPLRVLLHPHNDCPLDSPSRVRFRLPAPPPRPPPPGGPTLPASNAAEPPTRTPATRSSLAPDSTTYWTTAWAISV